MRSRNEFPAATLYLASGTPPKLGFRVLAEVATILSRSCGMICFDQLRQVPNAWDKGIDAEAPGRTSHTCANPSILCDSTG